MVFKKSVKEALVYYVYALVDPRDSKIFYIGKGKDDRVFQHAAAAIVDKTCNLKLDTIRSIKSEGKEAIHYIIRHNLEEREALLVESTLIDMLTYSKFNHNNQLTNLIAGHHQWDEGIKTVDEIKQLYDCEPLQLQKGHKLLMVNLNRSYIKKTADGMKVRSDLYEITRGHWHVNKTNADQVNYVLGVYRGVVRCVIKPTSKWKRSYEKSKTSRYYIEGVTDDKEGNNLYLNKDVTEYPFPSGGAIRYIRDSVESTIDVSPVTNLKTFDTAKKLKASDFSWDVKLWEPVKSERLNHIKV